MMTLRADGNIGGRTILQVAQDASELGYRTRAHIRFDFNGVDCLMFYNDNPKDLADNYAATRTGDLATSEPRWRGTIGGTKE